MHDNYIKGTDRGLVSEEDRFVWLLRGDLKVGNGSETKATQDQALQTKYHATKILQTEADTNADYVKNLMRQLNTLSGYQHV
jgi:hypothetical protein